LHLNLAKLGHKKRARNSRFPTLGVLKKRNEHARSYSKHKEKSRPHMKRTYTLAFIKALHQQKLQSGRQTTRPGGQKMKGLTVKKADSV